MYNLLNHTGEFPISKDIMSISAHWLTDEKEVMINLIEKAQVSNVQKAKIREQAYKLVDAVRKNRLKIWYRCFYD
jgi:RHH-type proline utilization regulon transcriptional repressor/proline dehydrogenase/delta 1-pyrroline-5-carboxylate dehydrogenase